MNKLLTTLLILLFVGLSFGYSQQTSHPGIELYKAGKEAEAVRSLEVAVKTKEYERNAEVWDYLGLAYSATNDPKNARKALEKAVKLAPENSIYLGNLAYFYLMEGNAKKARSTADRSLAINPKNFAAIISRASANYLEGKFDDGERESDLAISINPQVPQAYIIKSRILIGRLSKNMTAGSNIKKELPLFIQAGSVLEDGIKKCAPPADCSEIATELQSLEPFIRYFSKNQNDSQLSTRSDPSATTPPTEPGVTRLKIITKPRPSYTDKARYGNVQGTIRLAVMFGANGRIERALLLSRLGSGLDQEAMIAASRIKFEPEMKDGKPISVVKLLEYSFSIY